MSRRKRSPSSKSTSFTLVFLLCGLILFVAPWLRGGNREVAQMAMLALGLCLLALLLSTLTVHIVGRLTHRSAQAAGAHTALDSPFASVGRTWWVAFAVLASSPLWVAGLQLLELPIDWWQTLPGRADYLAALQSASVSVPEALPISLVPSATWSALWATLPVAAIFAATVSLEDRAFERLLLVLMGAAAVQVAMAVLQFGTGASSPLYFGAQTGGAFIGTFANRNHLANFLAMSLPIWVYFLHRHHQADVRGRHDKVFGVNLAGAIFRPAWLFLGFAFFVILLSTLSRGGLLAASIVTTASVGLYLVALRKHITRRQRYVLLAAVVLLVGLVAAAVGLEGITARVQEDRIKTDASVRNAMAWATFDAARQFWPWGSGMGSFEAVFPKFQDAATFGYVPHAHNDYPQLLLELGALVVIPVVCAVFLVLQQLNRLWRHYRAQHRVSSALAMRCYSGLGAAALLMHSWVEFNMHIPALALTVAFLTAGFLRPLPAASAHTEG